MAGEGTTSSSWGGWRSQEHPNPSIALRFTPGLCAPGTASSPAVLACDSHKEGSRTSFGMATAAAVPTLLRASLKSRTKSSITAAEYTPDPCHVSLFRQWSTVFNALFKMTEIRDKAVCFTDLLSNWEEKEVNPHIWRLHWWTQTSQALRLAGSYSS